MARADWLSGAGTLAGLESAIATEPSDGAMLALAAEYRNNRGETTPEIDRQLLRAARLNPLDSTIPMTLGIRAEFQGNTAAAEQYLVRAAEIDHQFKPAWTLANFYFRNGDPSDQFADRQEKTWRLIQRCLNLDPLGYDPEPVFDLCWRLPGDSTKILGQMPRHLLPGYLSYLVKTGRTDAALEAWPAALSAMNPAAPADTAAMKKFTGFLVTADRIDAAVQTWNQLIYRGVVRSGRLNPAAGVSIADPAFAYPASADTFGWDLDSVTGVFFSTVSPPLSVELDGNEPETCRILSVLAPVVPARKYHLIWSADSTAMSSPRDPGLSFEVITVPGETATECGPLLKTGGSGSCAFQNPAGRQTVRIALKYTRATGTTRIQGTLRLTRVNLEFGP